MEFLDTLNLSKDDQRRLIDRLEKHPLAKEPHRIAALRRLAFLEPERAEKIIEGAIEARTKLRGDDLLPLVRWLVEDRKPEKILTFLTEDIAMDSRALFPNYLNALMLAGRYDDLERAVRDPRARLTTAEKDYHLVHLAFVRNTLGEGGGEKIDDLLTSAVTSALNENRTEMLLQLGDYAEKRKKFKIATEAYKTATRTPRTERAAYEGLLRSSYLSGNTKDFIETSRETVRRWPDNQYFLERLLYASLLSGAEIEICGERARKLLDARPNDSQRKLLMAVYSQRIGDSQACRGFLQNSNLDDLTVGQRAVFCGLTRYAGFGGQAAELAKVVPLDQPMLPEELRYLNLARNLAAAATRF
jgi:tetratricopeptide (TPR) repeat protein